MEGMQWPNFTDYQDLLLQFYEGNRVCSCLGQGRATQFADCGFDRRPQECVRTNAISIFTIPLLGSCSPAPDAISVTAVSESKGPLNSPRGFYVTTRAE